MIQYPHTIYTFSTQPATQNELGDWVPGSSMLVDCGKCREETAGRGAVMSSVDYKDFVPAALIQAPLTCPHIAEGETVVVSNTPLDASTTMEQVKELLVSDKVKQALMAAPLWKFFAKEGLL